MKLISLNLLILSLLILTNCRGQLSEKPPIHLNPNMDNQQKYLPYGESKFFKDRRVLRPVPKGTISQNSLSKNPSYYTGKSNGKFLTKNPHPITVEFVKRGQDRYNIYCSVCHGYDGQGQGIVVKKGLVPPPSYTSARLLKYSDGEFFYDITNGERNMPSYKLQLSVQDRWAVVAYIRALQKSQKATLSDIPPEQRDNLR